MAINLPTGFFRTTNEPLDVRYLASGLIPYSSVAAANAAMTSTVRYIGQFVNVNNQLYWYQNGIADGNLVAFAGGGGGGSGTVTNVSVTTANGVSGTVSNPTTTPAISLSLGAITPSSVAATGTVTGSNLSGTNTGDQDLSNLVVKNPTITGATKTKITYDSKGLVTSGSDATTADIADTTDKRYQTDNQKLYNDATSSIQTQLNSKVTGVTASSPITSSGGTSPVISTSMSTNKLIGRSSAGTGSMEEITVGAGLSLSGGTLTNTATPTAAGYYGAWQDDVTQTAAASNVGYAMLFRTADITPNGVSIVNNGSGNPTRITFANTGIYNIQFSSQFQNTAVQDHDVTIWLRMNGTDLAGSSGFVSVPSSHGGTPGHSIAAWNYVLEAIGGQYYELIWSTDDHINVTMQFYAAGSPPPSAASVILTVTQQSGIMAGTGITAINSLTGSVQTFATGTSGTNFAISSVGTTHTFNLPVASATNTGKLSNTDWTTFNNKVTSNAAIVSATKTKITYDTKGLVTAGTDATTADISDSLNKRYVTDAQLVVIGNTSGVNTGDQTLSGLGGVPTSRTISTTTPLSGGGDLSANRTLSIADAVADGVTKGAATFNANDFNSATGVISLDYTNGQAASSSQNGFLSLTDWSTFNNKQPALSGTGFVKINGTTISYDNSTYYLASNPNGYTSNLGTVTSVGLSSSTTGVTIGSTPVTTSGTISLAIATASGLQQGLLSSTDWNTFNNKQNAFGSQTGNTFFAAPDGAPGVPSFRQIVAADIPTLNQNTTGSAGSVVNNLTFDNTGSGSSSGVTFNGSSAKTISYNTIGAQASSTNLTSLAALSYASTSFVKMTASGTFSLDTNTYVTSSALSSYVPYTGATSNVALGTFSLTSNNGIYNTEISSSYFGVENNAATIFGLLEYNKLTLTDNTGPVSVMEMNTLGLVFPNGSTQTVAGVTSVSGTSPIVSTGGTTPTISIPKATSLVNGYLSSTDWTTFNSKGDAFTTNPLSQFASTTSAQLATVISDITGSSSGAVLVFNNNPSLNGLTVTDANDIAFGTTTGTKIGKTTNQKLGFWNTTPDVQPTTAISSASYISNPGTFLNDADTFDGYTIAQVVAALRRTGLLA